MKPAHLVPFLVLSVFFAPIGVRCSTLLDTNLVKFFFVIFILISSLVLLLRKNVYVQGGERYFWLMYPMGAVVGFTTGLLGIGCGAIIIPLLAFMQYRPKSISVVVSFMIPFSTLVGFIAYVSIITVDWVLILVTSISSILVGYVGTHIMHNRLRENHVHIFIVYPDYQSCTSCLSP